MKDAVPAQLSRIADEVRAAAISDASKQNMLSCIDRLPTLYAKFRLSYESRDGEEIARLLQGALDELASSKPACMATQQLGARITERIRQLHEKSGIPGLKLKAPRNVIPLTKGRTTR